MPNLPYGGIRVSNRRSTESIICFLLKKILQLFLILGKFFWQESNRLFHSSLLQGCENKDGYLKALHWGNERHCAWASSEPWGRSKVLTRRCFWTKKGGTNPGISIDWLNGSITVTPKNGQVTKSNRTYTLREFRERFTKDRIRLHELSPLSKGQSICFFQKKLNQNQNHKIRKECHEHCTNFPLDSIVAYEVHIYRTWRQRLHTSASLKIMLTA